MKALHQPDPMGTAKWMKNYFLYLFLKKNPIDDDSWDSTIYY